MSYAPSSHRYRTMTYRRLGRSGLRLPEISLGLWHNFGSESDGTKARNMLRTAFDLGVTHFDLANNYGPPPGSAELRLGKLLKTDFRGYRDELVISTKAGYGMWPGPYGDGGSRKYLLSSLDQSLTRLGLDYVDIFYSHRFDPETPLEETMGALDAAVRHGKALYAGISNYSSEQTQKAASILESLGTPCVVHQASYSLFDRWTEQDNLLGTLERHGMGMVVFSPLSQGLLTSRYLHGIPEDSRAAKSPFLTPEQLTDTRLAQIRSLSEIAINRGQSLAQFALSWVLRDSRVTSAIIGASRESQVRDCVLATGRCVFTDEEIERIDAICDTSA